MSDPKNQPPMNYGQRAKPWPMVDEHGATVAPTPYETRCLSLRQIWVEFVHPVARGYQRIDYIDRRNKYAYEDVPADMPEVDILRLTDELMADAARARADTGNAHRYSMEWHVLLAVLWPCAILPLAVVVCAERWRSSPAVAAVAFETATIAVCVIVLLRRRLVMAMRDFFCFSPSRSAGV